MATLKSGPQQPSALTAQKPKAQVLEDDEDIIRTLGLDWTSERTKCYLEGVPRFYPKRLQVNELPIPVGTYCAETWKIKQYWEEAWDNLPYADKRIGKTSGRRIQVVDRSNFQHVIRRGDSGLFFDEATKELVFARLPGMVRDSAILEAMNEVCKSAARVRRGDRVSPHGKPLARTWSYANLTSATTLAFWLPSVTRADREMSANPPLPEAS
jgi:hypothetical protein